MTMQFTKNVEQYTTSARAERIKNFVEFASKKQLAASGLLDEETMNFVQEIKGTFSFALHKDGRYLAITLYKANAEKHYSFLVVDLEEQAIAECDSIKNAKAGILELVG